MMRRFLCAWIGGFVGLQHAFAALTVVDQEIHAIRLSPDIVSELPLAVEDFWTYVVKRSDARLDLLPDYQGDGILIRIAPPGDFSSVARPLRDQAFRIKTSRGRLEITAMSYRGLRIGLYYFLMKYGGIRWYWPGTAGEYVPPGGDWSLGRIDERAAPAYYSRVLSGLQTPEGERWATRNLLLGTIPSYHNLSRVFQRAPLPSHPDWIGWRNGKRKLPSKESLPLWHPALLQPGVAAFAAHVAIDYFQHHPREMAFSICINDSTDFDLSPEAIQFISPVRYFRNRPVYTDPVFTFSNRVAEQVAKKYPEKYLSAFAYYWCEAAPRFKVHPKVIPFLTSDRAQYYDADFASEDRNLIKAWSRSGCDFFGLYDYFESGLYWIPRFTTGAQLDVIQEAYQAGARAYYGELHPAWAFEGPRGWMAASLIFDPTGDKQAMLQDFYAHFFGRAHEPMRGFYALCETLWNTQPGRGRWLKYYRNPQQLELVSIEQIKTMTAYLTRAKALAQDDKVRRRIDLVRYAVEAMKAAWRLYHEAAALTRPSGAPKDEDQGIEPYLRAAAGFDRAISEIPDGAVEALRRDPYLKLSEWINPLPTWILRHPNQGRGFERQDPRDKRRAGALAAYRAVQDALKAPGKNRLLNAEFAVSPFGWVYLHPLARHPTPLMSHWKCAPEADETTRIMCFPENKDGSNSIQFMGGSRIDFKQRLKADPGSRWLWSWDSRGLVNYGNLIEAKMRFYDANSKPLASSIFVYPYSVLPEWTPYALSATAPKGCRWLAVEWRIGGQEERDYFELRHPRLLELPR